MLIRVYPSPRPKPICYREPLSQARVSFHKLKEVYTSPMRKPLLISWTWIPGLGPLSELEIGLPKSWAQAPFVIRNVCPRLGFPFITWKRFTQVPGANPVWYAPKSDNCDSASAFGSPRFVNVLFLFAGRSSRFVWTDACFFNLSVRAKDLWQPGWGQWCSFSSVCTNSWRGNSAF